MKQIGTEHDCLRVVAHQCHSRGVIEDPILYCQAAVMNETNNSHMAHDIETMETNIVHPFGNLDTRISKVLGSTTYKEKLGLTAMLVYMRNVNRINRNASFLSSNGGKSLLTYAMVRVTRRGWQYRKIVKRARGTTT